MGPGAGKRSKKIIKEVWEEGKGRGNDVVFLYSHKIKKKFFQNGRRKRQECDM